MMDLKTRLKITNLISQTGRKAIFALALTGLSGLCVGTAEAQVTVSGPRFVPETYNVKKGDTLWDITGRHYGNPWQWPQVWSYNPEITNPHWIYPNDVLRLTSGDGTGEANLPMTTAAPSRPRGAGVIYLRDRGFLDKKAVENSGVIVGSPEENMLLSPFDEIYLRFDNEAPVIGKTYTLYRQMDEKERIESEEGELVRIYGSAKLITFDKKKKVGKAKITEAFDPIERGFRMADMPRRFEAAAPRKNSKDLEGAVVATLRPQRLLANQQVVFVNKGKEDGVQSGNRFFVTREGDDWRQSLQHKQDMGEIYPDAEEAESYPTEVIAEGRVVSVRPKTSTLVITNSLHEVTIGDRVELRKGF